MNGPILVLGATGFLGAPVARRLQKDGYQVRVMSRSGERLREMFGDSFEIAVGDAMNTADLDKALDGCSGVHISVSSEQEDTCVKNIVSAASGKSLERLTYMSGSTVFEKNAWFPMVRRKLNAETAIRESGIPYTVFCPTWFMDMLPRFARDGRATTMGKQPLPCHWVATDDLARMVAAAYATEEAVKKRVFVHGPEAFTMAEAILRYCAVFQPDIDKVSAMPLWLARVIATLTRNDILKAAIPLMAYFEKTPEGGDPGEANRILGTPKITLDQWIEQQKSTKHT